MLFTDESDPSLTLITRAETLRNHAGQMALPGGAVDPGDEGPLHTALREAQEETGLPADSVTPLGELPALWVPASGFDVTTVIGVWDGGTRLHPVDPAETGAVHSYPVSLLASPATRRLASHPSGFTGPAFELGDEFIWGLTGHLIDWVLHLGGWEQQWKRHPVPIPTRYLRD